jgi:hypothetical protein
MPKRMVVAHLHEIRMNFITTIQILDSTRNRLKRSCRKDQTYDDKINQLLDLELNR